MALERLQKILSRAGVASRRAGEKMIAEGRISVNGAVVTEPGTKADPERDEIRVDGRLVSLETEKLYIALHKPPGYVTTLSDPQGRPIVTDLLTGVAERVYPVGRLDYDSEGLLILTNDGEFAQRLQHPRYGIPKTYRVKVEGNLTKGELKALEDGIDLPDGRFAPVERPSRKDEPREHVAFHHHHRREKPGDQAGVRLYRPFRRPSGAYRRGGSLPRIAPRGILAHAGAAGGGAAFGARTKREGGEKIRLTFI